MITYTWESFISGISAYCFWPQLSVGNWKLQNQMQTRDYSTYGSLQTVHCPVHSQCSETLALGDDGISNDVWSLLKDAKYCYFQSIFFLFHLKKKCPFLRQLPSFPWSLWRLKSPPGYLLLPGKQIPSLGFLWKYTPLWVPSCDTASSWATWRIPLMKQKKTVIFSGICSLTCKIWISSEQYMQEGQSLWDFQLH